MAAHYFAHQPIIFQVKGHKNHMVIKHAANWLCNWQTLALNKQCPNEINADENVNEEALLLK